jgi:hypothetical protein
MKSQIDLTTHDIRRSHVETWRHVVQSNCIGLFSSLYLILGDLRVGFVAGRVSGATHFNNMHQEEDEVCKREEAIGIRLY